MNSLLCGTAGALSHLLSHIHWQIHNDFFFLFHFLSSGAFSFLYSIFMYNSILQYTLWRIETYRLHPTYSFATQEAIYFSTLYSMFIWLPNDMIAYSYFNQSYPPFYLILHKTILSFWSFITLYFILYRIKYVNSFFINIYEDIHIRLIERN